RRRPAVLRSADLSGLGSAGDVKIAVLDRGIKWRVGEDAVPGSSAQPIVSPNNPQMNTMPPKARPGKSDTHHWPSAMNLAPPAIIAPSSGVGGLTPAPTKLSPAVRSTAKPIVTDNCTTTVGNALGSKCTKASDKSERPMARAASAKGRCRKDNSSDLTSRRNTGKLTKATARMTFSV